MLQTHGADLQDQDRFAGRRTHEGADNYESTPLAAGEHLDWMRLERIGDVLNGYMSIDGSDWQLFGTMDWGDEAPRTVLLGLAVCSHTGDGCQTASITFDEVEIQGGEGPHEARTLRGGTIAWTPSRALLSSEGLGYTVEGRSIVRVSGLAGDRIISGPEETFLATVKTQDLGVFERAHDVGLPCVRGDTEYSSSDGSYSVLGYGSDIWTGGDQFQFVYKSMEGDFRFEAHVRERLWAPGTRWGKVGIMARQDCTPRARYAMMQTHGEDLQDADRFAARPTQGGADNYEVTNLLPAEHRDWMRIDRVGSVFTGYFSIDGVDWQKVASMDWGDTAPAEVLVGLAVCGRADTTGGCLASLLTFDEVSLTTPTTKKTFHRGDPNDDGQMNITDGIYVLNYLFLGGPGPGCAESADANDDGTLNITDGIFVLNYLFLGGPAPPSPGPPTESCGPAPDGTVDTGCETYQSCP
jgi:regulation of enolase protein 1 (concanavalin A-like superfamily)